MQGPKGIGGQVLGAGSGRNFGNFARRGSSVIEPPEGGPRGPTRLGGPLALRPPHPRDRSREQQEGARSGGRERSFLIHVHPVGRGPGVIEKFDGRSTMEKRTPGDTRRAIYGESALMARVMVVTVMRRMAEIRDLIGGRLVIRGMVVYWKMMELEMMV